ncbi:MAG: divalent-cation tolerance protein CutA [Rhodanobacteraceae bacterium]|nr:MAG: divalent-cation tolerance protein CutA [Rhodanobacteraceae bacterium]
MATPLLCISTCPDATSAGHIAQTLVTERLAACVNRMPGVRSTYRWQGKLQDDAEVLLVIKTTRERFAALRTRLLELSPYATPELIALDIVEGSAAYLGWIAAETTPEATGA